jgi:hypothetical protein
MHRPTFRPAALAIGGFLLAATAACHRGAMESASQTRMAACQGAESGRLRVTNQSGAIIEIHTWRPEGPTVFMGTVSPGVTTFDAEAPSNLAVRYGASAQGSRSMAVTVSWLRPHARGSGGVLLDLECVTER